MRNQRTFDILELAPNLLVTLRRDFECSKCKIDVLEGEMQTEILCASEDSATTLIGMRLPILKKQNL